MFYASKKTYNNLASLLIHLLYDKVSLLVIKEELLSYI